MPSTRRALLRASALGVFGSLAGCSADREAPTETAPSEQTTGRTATETLTERTTTDSVTESTTTEPTTAEPTVSATNYSAVEFTHRTSVLDSGIGDAETQYYVRVFDDEADARQIDVARARRDLPGGKLDRLERFVADTDFDSAALLAVQATFSASNRGLSFDFVDRDARPPQVVTRVENRDGSGSGPVTATVFVRVLAEYASELAVTVVDFVDAGYGDQPHPIRTFAPPNETMFESRRVLLDAESDPPIPRSGGALVTTPKTAREFARKGAAFAKFVANTDFERSSLLAVRKSVDSGDYLWPQHVEHEGSRVMVRLRLQAFATGLNRMDDALTLVRFPDPSHAERGTATMTLYRTNNPETPTNTATIRLSSDPEDWTESTTTGNRS